jgi:hypothetical protein
MDHRGGGRNGDGAYDRSQTIQSITQISVTNRKTFFRTYSPTNGMKILSKEAILENVRRFRTIASLYRQTAAFRPDQSWSLLGQAKDWEYRALVELETYFKGSTQPAGAQFEIAIAA